MGMAGIIDWLNKRMNRTDVEVAAELVPEQPAGTGRGRPGRAARPRVAEPREVDDGVYVRPTPITAGDSIVVKYSGLLAKSGAQEVHLHMGYGYGAWDRVSDIPMRETTRGSFETEVHLPIEETSRFNFCFRDNAGNWDNNSGRDWSYEIHAGELAGLS